MGIAQETVVVDAGEAMRTLLESMAEEVAEETGVVQRQRKFSAATLAQTFVLGFLQKSDASDEDLAAMAGAVGTQVTPQAVEQRFSPRLVTFLSMLFCRAVRLLVRSRKSLAPLLDRFTDVLVMDSTTVTLPDELAGEFPGCGGSYGGGKAAVKFQTRLSLKTGALDAVAIEPGRDCDQKTPLQDDPLPIGALRIADLGYFDISVFEHIGREKGYWLSRLLCGTNVYDLDGKLLKLLPWLATQGSQVDQWILLGAQRQLRCRLLAWRVPDEVANRRRQKLIEEHRRKGRTPSAERLAWCDWMILVTNAPLELLSPGEAWVLYRSRWQIELLFKRWKSQGLIAQLSGSTVVRKMVRLWSRMLAVIVQHWLAVTCTWGDARRSLKKICETIRTYAITIALTIDNLTKLNTTIDALIRATHSTARQNKRKRPSTFELLNDPSKLDYTLT